MPHPCCWTDPHQWWLLLLQLLPGTCPSLLSKWANSYLLTDSLHLISALLSSVFAREIQHYGKQKEWPDIRLYLLTLSKSRITMWPSGKMGSLSAARQMWPLTETLCCRKLLKARADQEPTTCDHLAGTVLHNVCGFFSGCLIEHFWQSKQRLISSGVIFTLCLLKSLKYLPDTYQL